MIESLRDKVNWAADQPYARRQDGKRGSVTQSLLATLPEFSMSESSFNRFLRKGQLNADQLDVLCKWLGCSEHALVTFSLDMFKANPNGIPLSWQELFASAIRHGFLETDGPRLDLQTRAGGPTGKLLRQPKEPPPVFSPKALIRVVAPAQQGDVSAAGWPVLVFGYDKDGFDNLLPRFAADFGSCEEERMPEDQGVFVFPQKPQSFEIYEDAVGEHAIIVVAHRDGFPTELVNHIQAARMPAQLVPHLDKLASWLGGRRPDNYLVWRQDYLVA